jgi:O-acetyl-ADP-ribose deacetylase (regulator of RNase III)
VRPDEPQISLWQGDITRLAVDAIVNAANSQMLGCFVPCHGCIDNAIHTAAGVRLRLACAELMDKQGTPEPTGRAKITQGFNLPARNVLHTVGPIVPDGHPSQSDQELLASCYRSCLELACEYGLSQVAFCCISTGEFGYPQREAAVVAVNTVRSFLSEDTDMKVVFDVFSNADLGIYQELLN